MVSRVVERARDYGEGHNMGQLYQPITLTLGASNSSNLNKLHPKLALI
jgi:hypothetical protein